MLHPPNEVAITSTQLILCRLPCDKQSSTPTSSQTTHKQPVNNLTRQPNAHLCWQESAQPRRHSPRLTLQLRGAGWVCGSLAYACMLDMHTPSWPACLPRPQWLSDRRKYSLTRCPSCMVHSARVYSLKCPATAHDSQGNSAKPAWQQRRQRGGHRTAYAEANA
jgi:hypothetical protein